MISMKYIGSVINILHGIEREFKSTGALKKRDRKIDREIKREIEKER